jgi:hypothetical protein
MRPKTMDGTARAIPCDDLSTSAGPDNPRYCPERSPSSFSRHDDPSRPKLNHTARQPRVIRASAMRLSGMSLVIGPSLIGAVRLCRPPFSVVDLSFVRYSRAVIASAVKQSRGESVAGRRDCFVTSWAPRNDNPGIYGANSGLGTLDSRIYAATVPRCGDRAARSASNVVIIG